MKKYTLFLLALLLSNFSFAGELPEEKIDMADAMYASGKIYVVIAVIAVIFIGIVIYLVSIDRKLRRLENERK